MWGLMSESGRTGVFLGDISDAFHVSCSTEFRGVVGYAYSFGLCRGVL
jgi:hypothetical protein